MARTDVIKLGDTKTIRPFALKCHGSIAYSASPHHWALDPWPFRATGLIVKYKFQISLVVHVLPTTQLEGDVRGVRKPQNRTKIRQKNENRIGFFPKYRNRMYMEVHCMKADVGKACGKYSENGKLCVDIKHTIITLAVYCTTLLYCI